MIATTEMKMERVRSTEMLAEEEGWRRFTWDGHVQLVDSDGPEVVHELGELLVVHSKLRSVDCSVRSCRGGGGSFGVDHRKR